MMDIITHQDFLYVVAGLEVDLLVTLGGGDPTEGAVVHGFGGIVAYLLHSILQTYAQYGVTSTRLISRPLY